MDIKQYGKEVSKKIDNMSDKEFDELLIKAGIENCPYECPKCGGDMDKEGIECMYCGFSRC